MIELEVPGDKSITHRSLILSALGQGTSHVAGALVSEDTCATARILRALGAEVAPLAAAGCKVSGPAGGVWRSPEAPLDCGNSGTTARLMLGVLAGSDVTAVLDGDDSLRQRPMERVTRPLAAMGARFEASAEEGRLPLQVHGARLGPLDYRSPLASAQVKSALLLAALASRTWVLYSEPRRSRDHSERMLEVLGIPLVEHWQEGAWRVELRDVPEAIPNVDWRVPGDFSSAAFWLGYGLLRGGEEPLRIRAVGTNPTRSGLLDVIRRMGGRVEVIPSQSGPEPLSDLVVWPSPLRATDVAPDEVPGLIDELPVFGVLASRAQGRSRVSGAGELRVKESDRIRTMVENLHAVGVDAGEFPDGFEVEGTDEGLAGSVATRGDHRIAMAFGVLGAVSGDRIHVDDADAAAVSYPTFFRELWALREGRDRTEPRKSESPRRPKGRSGARRDPVVTIDGPAGSGKSTTARAVAERLGFRHLDSGALYRGLTLAFLRRGWDPASWPERTLDEIEALGVRARPTQKGVDVLLGDEVLSESALRGKEVTAHVSQVASLARVREALLSLQRQAAEGGGLVADGRDMGSEVFPDAEVKVFFTADLTERARRRLLQRSVVHPDGPTLQAEASLLQGRDFADAHRKHSPLRAAPDAYRLDTSALDFEAQVDAVVELVQSRRRRG